MNRNAYILLLALLGPAVVCADDTNVGNQQATQQLDQLVANRQGKVTETAEGVKQAQENLRTAGGEEIAQREYELEQAEKKHAVAQKDLADAQGMRNQSAAQQPKFQDGERGGGQQAQAGGDGQGGGGEGGGSKMPPMMPQAPQPQQQQSNNDNQQPTPAPLQTPSIAAATPAPKPTDDPYALTKQMIENEKQALADAKASTGAATEVANPQVKSVAELMNEMMEQKLKEAEAQKDQAPGSAVVAQKKGAKGDEPVAPPPVGSSSGGGGATPAPETPYATDGATFGNGRAAYVGGASIGSVGGGAPASGGDGFFGASSGPLALVNQMLGRTKRVAADGAPAGGDAGGAGASSGGSGGGSDLSSWMSMLNPAAGGPAGGGSGSGATLPGPAPVVAPASNAPPRGLAAEDETTIVKKAPNYKMDIEVPAALKRVLSKQESQVIAGSSPQRHLRLGAAPKGKRLSLRSSL